MKYFILLFPLPLFENIGSNLPRGTSFPLVQVWPERFVYTAFWSSCGTKCPLFWLPVGAAVERSVRHFYDCFGPS